MSTHSENIFILSLGSNTPDGSSRLQQAIALLRERLSYLTVSTVYSTPSISAGDHSIYFNAVVRGCSSMTPEQMIKASKDWERELGRDSHSHKGGPVVIDIDIVECNGQILRPRDYSRDYYLIGRRQLDE